MELDGKVVVVTGGGNGIGRALCRRFATERAKGVVVADIAGDRARAVADELTHSSADPNAAIAVSTDVAVEADVVALVRAATETYGGVDLFCANAGIAVGGGPEASDEEWQRIWSVNLMAHVYAARALLPAWLERGGGYLLHTASAAGLLTNLGALPYAVTKHAMVALAEWLSVTYGDAGIRVSCLCPQGVRTDMLFGAGPASAALLEAGAIEPDDVAEAVVAGLADERFLILPHPEVADYLRRKADDPDRWLRGMRRLRARATNAG